MSALIQTLGAPAQMEPDPNSVIFLHSEFVEIDWLQADLDANRRKAERAQSYAQRQAIRLQIQNNHTLGEFQ